jgi:hypothetical protein
VSDPLPPPADTPKPRPDAPGLWLWIGRFREWHEVRKDALDRLVFVADSEDEDDSELVSEIAASNLWYGPYDPSRLWQPAALPEGHAELMRGAADALDSEASGHEMEGGSKGHARELYALAARLRAAAGGETS